MDELPAPPSAPPSSIKPARIAWPGGPSKKQSFAFPSSIIYYILKNPSSPTGYNKLSQSCKYFFEGNPILVVKNMFGNTICSNDDCKGEAEDDECCVKFDISKISSKIWLTNELSIDEDRRSDFTSILCQKLFRSDAYYINILDKDIMFDDFNVLASNSCDISLSQVKIIYEDGNDVLLENIFESFPSTVESFYYLFGESEVVPASTMNKIAKLEKFQQLKSFQLYCIPETVLIEDLSNMIKDHENISFKLDFHPDISEDYMDQIDVLINTVIESQVPNRMIWYPGQDEEQKRIMKDSYIDEELGDSEAESDDDEEMDVEGLGADE